jgi:rare lipoprotein A
MNRKITFFVLLGMFFLTSCSVQRSGSLVERIRAGYYPYKVKKFVRPGYKEFGSASWYGRDFHGKVTASGEMYNMYSKTAAHKTLPFGTYVRVINLNNHKETIVKINDRGPFVKNRIIDLSYAAAKDLGMADVGTAPVEIVVLGTKNPNTTNSVDEAAYKKIVDKSENIKTVNNKVLNKPLYANTVENIDASAPLYTIQIGSFRSLANALSFKNRASKHIKGAYVKRVVFSGYVFYRVVVGSFSSKEEANSFANRFVAPVFRSFCVSLK